MWQLKDRLGKYIWLYIDENRNWDVDIHPFNDIS